MTFTAKEKLQCAEREVRQRKHVFERLVNSGKMTNAKADREIALMAEIATDYAKLAEQEEARERLI